MLQGSDLLFLGSVIASLAASIYIFWGPAPKRRAYPDHVPGLQNVGNSCFLNAVLQALAACPSILKWLDDEHFFSERNGIGSLLYTLRKVLRALNNYGGENISLTSVEVLAALKSSHWIIANEEQDAHELYHALTTTLEEEGSIYHYVLPLFEVSKLESATPPADKIDNHIVSRLGVPAVKILLSRYNFPTRGLLCNQLKCVECGFKYPMKYDSFDSISLAIPTTFQGSLSLEDCLKRYIMSETVNDVLCEGCTKPGSESCRTTFTKRLSFGKLPQCLCIHIQRTVWLKNGLTMKRFDHVQFREFLNVENYWHSWKRNNFVRQNINLVNMYPWMKLTGGKYPSVCIPDKKDKKCSQLYFKDVISLPVPKISAMHYQLRAVIVHLGDTFCGHFVTYRRGPLASRNALKWFYTSDTAAKVTSLSEVLQSPAYMLFYERM